MKKRIVLTLLAVILTLGGISLNQVDVFNLTLQDYTGATTLQTEQTSYIQDQGDIQLIFCPHQDCEGQLNSFIAQAQQSIHCAFFELDLESVQDTILEKHQQGLDVQIVTDDQYLYEFNQSFVKTDRSGLMHNKFCIIDNKYVSSGSMNPTNNGAHKNNNNLILISSTTLAINYEEEFQELSNNIFKKGNPVQNPSIKISNSMVTNFFCPDDNCAQQIKQELIKANQSIYFMTFSFTHEEISDILLLKYKDGLDIKGVFEARQVSKYSRFEQLERAGLDVHKDGNKQNMHHKVFIIDGHTVITGSMNPSKGGDTRNDENVLIIQDQQIAQLFLEEFEKVYTQSNS